MAMAMQNDVRSREQRLMLMFLRGCLDAERYPCLKWVFAERGIASLSWTHGGKSEMPLFEGWRIYKGYEIIEPEEMKHSFHMAIGSGAGVRYLKPKEIEELGLSQVKDMKYIKLDPIVTPTRQEAASDPSSDSAPSTYTQNAHTSSTGSVPATVEEFSSTLVSPPTRHQSLPLIGQSQSQPIYQPHSQPSDQLQSQPTDQPQSQTIDHPQSQPTDQSQSQTIDYPQILPLGQPLGRPQSTRQPTDFDILRTAIELTLEETPPQPEVVYQPAAEEPVRSLERIIQQRPHVSVKTVPEPNFRDGGGGTEGWVDTLTTFVFDPPDLSKYKPAVTITSSDDRMLRKLIESEYGSSASMSFTEESLASDLKSMSISDHSWSTGSAERAADQLRADGTVVDNEALLVQLNRSPKRLRDCDLPENVGDRGEEFVVVVRCEGRIECVQVVETSCRLVRDRKTSRGPDGIRQIPMCRRSRTELKSVPVLYGILNSCDGGLLIQCDRVGNIFATRGMPCRVYWRKPHDVTTPVESLKRNETIIIFDHNSYCNCLRSKLKSPEIQLPGGLLESWPEVLLDIGNGGDVAEAKLLVTVMSRKAHEVYTYCKDSPAPKNGEDLMKVSDRAENSAEAMNCE